MTLTRYQIRNEYGLADKELYQSTDKEDAEALLEGSSMAGLVGLLRQLGDLAEFAGEVFRNLHEELMITAARGKGLATRLQQLESEVPKSVEIPILSQTDHSIFLYDPGLEWHSTLQTDENLISPHKLPHCIMDSYEECRGPPQLCLLDKFDVDGSGSCLKRYSDPSLLKTLTASKRSNDERPSKTKKKVSHTSKEERLGDSQTSHSKLHQLFLVEHVENGHNNPEFHVKLKRRHLNGTPINSSFGTGYMEKFLKNSLPYCERIHETVDQSSSAMETEVTACNGLKDLSTPFVVYPSNGDTKNERDMGSIADYERPYMEEGPVISLERSSPVNLCGRDAPASTETEEKEADGDDKADGNIRQMQICDIADEGGTKALQTNEAEDDHSQHVFSVETESEMSLTGLVEDQFASITNQETEKESDIQIQNISTFDSFEDISLDVDAVHDRVVPKEDETMNPSASSWQEGALANSDVSEISSDCRQEDPQVPDTQRDGTVFAGDNQTSLNDKASDTVPDVVDLETTSDLQECFSPEYYIETRGQGEESPSETEAAAASLPSQDVPLSVQCSPSEEKEALNAPHQGAITSFNDISESVLSMDPIDQENCLDVPMAPFSTSLHEITPPLPPLPPTQWWMGKLVESAVPYNEYIHSDENTHDGQVSSEASVTAGENHNTDVYTVEALSTPEETTLNAPSKATEEEQSPSESTEGLEALEWFSQNLKEHTNTNLASLEEEPHLDHPLAPPGETERDKNSYEQNEKVEKLPRDKGSLVIGIDKSMLRKVSERNKTQLGARMEENDSLLEIIRSKSFNLRPADASVRHNFQVAVPTTNLKVAAILEKANSLRHAMAGSDDEHDSDSWSE